MQRACIQWCGAAAAAVFALLMAAPLRAADNSGMRPVAEELGQRTKPAAAPEAEQKGGLSDSAVRVLMTYAISIIPDNYPGPDGKPVKVDKGDPNKFVIPVDDARRIVRAATRSAYAEVCDLKDLARANFETLMKGEEAKKIWSKDQMLLISALHMFSVSYFTGSIKITTTEEPKGAAAKPPAEGASAAASPRTGSRAEAADAAWHRDRDRRPEAADLLAGAEGEGDERNQRLCGGQCVGRGLAANGQDAPGGQASVGAGLPAAALRPAAAPIDTFRHSRVESGAKLKPVRL